MKAAANLSAMLRRFRNPRGFTLVEVMIASAIGAITLAGVAVTYIMSINGLAAMSNYTQIHEQGRNAMEYFAKDMRSVTNITSFANPSNITVIIPTGFSSSGAVTNTATISYTTSAGALYRYDSRTGRTDLLATNLTRLAFTLYDNTGNTSGVAIANAKGVQVNMAFLKLLGGSLTQSEDFLTARYVMRNTSN